MGFDRLDDLGVERPLLGGGAKGAVAHMPPGAAGDLGDLGGGQPARAAAVEFADAGKGDMVEIHVEAHADRVGGDQIVDLAGLEHADLGVARPRADSAPSTTAVPPRWRRISSASENTSATAKATTALRGGSRVTFFWPV